MAQPTAEHEQPLGRVLDRVAEQAGPGDVAAASMLRLDEAATATKASISAWDRPDIARASAQGTSSSGLAAERLVPGR